MTCSYFLSSFRIFPFSPMWLPLTISTSPPCFGTTVCTSFSLRSLMNLCWPCSSLKMHQNSDSLRTSLTITFLRQYCDCLSMIFTLMFGTIHFNLFFFLPQSFPSFAYFYLAYYFVMGFTSFSATFTTELLLVSSTITSFSLTSTTLPINPSWAPLMITTSAPISNFGFFSQFSCSAPSPNPLGLGFKISKPFNAFFLLCPMPRQGVNPMLCSIDIPKFQTGLPSQACRSGASAYLEKLGSCFISFNYMTDQQQMTPQTHHHSSLSLIHIQLYI